MNTAPVDFRIMLLWLEYQWHRRLGCGPVHQLACDIHMGKTGIVAGIQKAIEQTNLAAFTRQVAFSQVDGGDLFAFGEMLYMRHPEGMHSAIQLIGHRPGHIVEFDATTTVRLEDIFYDFYNERQADEDLDDL
jgi:hypothetical protein